MTPDYSPIGPPAGRPLHFPNSIPKGPPALSPSMTRTALKSTYNTARGRGEIASLSVKTRGGRETLVFCSKDSNPKGSDCSSWSDTHNSVKGAKRRHGREGKQSGVVEEGTDPGIEAISRGGEDTGDGTGDYYCMRTAAGDSGRSGPQKWGSVF